MSEDNPNISGKQIFVEQLVSVERVSLNVAQSVIVTTEDKIRLSLDWYLRRVKRRTDWIAPFSTLLAILATLVTATFNDFVFSREAWRTIFVIAGCGSAVWLLKALWGLQNNVTVEKLIEEIRTGDRHNGSRGARGGE